jgi:hypothetical protein
MVGSDSARVCQSTALLSTLTGGGPQLMRSLAYMDDIIVIKQQVVSSPHIVP